MASFAPPWTPQQQLKFFGLLNDADEPHQSLSFYVLAGAGAPTPTDGWAQINTIARARRLGFTFPAGYNPAAMDIPIRFQAGYGKFGFTPAQIEHNIQILEWMAGRGKLYANGTHPAHGNPPIVQVSSFKSGSSVSTNLIPPNFHSDGANDIRWLISQLQYDTNPIRNSNGDRTQQNATVSVVEYVAVPGAPTSPRQRQQGRGTASGFQTFTTTAAVDTIAKVCIRHGINNATKWGQVVAFNLSFYVPGLVGSRATVRVSSWNQQLRLGTKVRIPKSVF